MPDWVTCPHCQLKHTARPDGFCPRCREDVNAAPAEVAMDSRPPLPPVMNTFQPPPPATDDVVPPGAKVAGAVMVANGVLSVIEKVVMGPGESPLGVGSFASALIDLGVGGMLIAGKEGALPWAKIRVGLGLVLLPIILMASPSGGGLLAAMQVVFSLGLLLMLLGRAGAVRLGAGALACGLCLLLEVVGLAAVGLGKNPLGKMAMSGELESAPVKVVDGAGFSYRLHSDSATGWYPRKADRAHKDNPLADRWLVQPERDAHVLVIAERVAPTARIDMDRFMNVVLDSARKNAAGLTVVEQRPISNPGGYGRLVHTKGKVNGQDVEFYYGLYAREPEIYQVVAFTTQRNFSRMEPQLYEWASSLETVAR